MKMKIYIEDPLKPDMTVNETPCRKLGVLKNGEAAVFEIGENEAKVFVIADKASKGFCSDFYQLPSGCEDIALTGENKFNPFAGNPFRFDGNLNPEALNNRKKGAKKGKIIFIAALIVGFIIGLAAAMGSGEAKPKEFSHDGMTITLTDEFRKTEAEGFSACYESPEAAVLVIKESFDPAGGYGEYTVEDYGELVLQNNTDISAEIQNDSGLTYFVYTAAVPETDDTYFHFAALYKSDDAFWIVEFAAPQENAESYAGQFAEWAKSVKFAASAAA